MKKLMDQTYKKLEKDITRKIKYRNTSKKRFYKDLKVITALSWIFVLPIVLFVVLGNYLKKVFVSYPNLTMTLSVIVGIVFSCINILCVLKRIYKENKKL